MSKPTENQWTQYATRIKIDGLEHISRSEYLASKFAWLLVLVTCGSTCIYLTIGSINEYLSYHVITTNRYLRESSAVFPTVTICPINTFSTEYAYELLAKAKATRINSIEYYMKNTTGSYLTDEQKQRMSDFDKILISCTFNGVECGVRDFRWMWHSLLGNCYQFNSGYDMHNQPTEVQKILVTGIPSSLFLQLYTGLPHMLSKTLGKSNQPGFYVYIRNSTDYINGIMRSVIKLTPGLGADINVVRTFYSQFNELPYKYSECRVNEKNELIGPPLDDPYLFEQVVATNKSYARYTCLLFCYQLIIVDICKCNTYNVEFRVPGYDICVTLDQVLCTSTYTQGNLTRDNFSYKNIECFSKCPLECNERLLTTEMSYYQYPTSTDVYTLSNDPVRLAKYKDQQDFTNLTRLSNHLIQFSVLYQSLSYTTIEEKPEVTFENLIGTLGGHLHLFLGMSIFSFFEILEMLATNILISKIPQDCMCRRRQITQVTRVKF